MIIQDVVDLARYSEVSSTAIKDNTDAILLFINAGMLELYKRFPVKVEEHIITLVEGTTTYSLPTDFMYPLSAHGEVEEGSASIMSELPINDESNPLSVFLPNHTQVQIPAVEDGAIVSIIYVVKPTRYCAADTELELDLPETLIEPLLHYVGYKAHLGIRSDAQTETNAHYVRFDASCKKARELGVAYPMDSWGMPSRVSSRGFV